MVLGGCGSGEPLAGSTAGPITVGADLGLPGCGKPPSPSADEAPPGSVLPPGTTVTAARSQPPISQFNGYVTMTPVQVREWIQAQDDLEVLVAEDEGFESELLVGNGKFRTFVKARAVCAEASLLAQVIAPADSAVQLPTPAGGTPAP